MYYIGQPVQTKKDALIGWYVVNAEQSPLFEVTIYELEIVNHVLFVVIVEREANGMSFEGGRKNGIF